MKIKSILLLITFYLAIYATCYLFQTDTFHDKWYIVANKLIIFINSWVWFAGSAINIYRAVK